MEKDKLFLNEDNTMAPTWNSSTFGMEIQSNELNCGSEPLPHSFLDPNWDNSMDQSDPFESALSSMVSSPAASAGGGDGVVLRELIGRLGSICNSGEVSPQSYIGNNSTNTSCYSTPLNSPPKLNLSVMDQQIRGNFNFPVHPTLSPFPSDPGFAERAAKFSSFGGGNFLLQSGQFGLSESEFPHRLTPRMESTGLVSRVSSNLQPSKVSVSPMDKKFSSLSKSSTPENTEFGDSREGSSVSEQISGGEIGMKAQNDANAKKRKSIPRGKVKETPSSSPAKDAKIATENEEESNAKKSKPEESENGKAGGDGNLKQTKDSSKPPEPPKDYIHVRARRGQATDSHSLAERVRREKISERMKFLQDLVPGCNKVTGKAVMLDEIINYVQSLQRQVEFLSMKLSTVNPRMDFNMEALLSKDILQPRGSIPHNTYPLETISPAFPHGFQSPQGPSLNIGIPDGTETFSMNPFNAALHRNPSMPLPPIDGFGEAISQPSTVWEQDDLQSVVQMGFGQNQAQNLHGTMGTAQMKVEL